MSISPFLEEQVECSDDSDNLVITANVDLTTGSVFSASQLASFGLPFLIIPQSYTAADQIEVNLQRPIGGTAETITLSNPISAWEAGKSYRIYADVTASYNSMPVLTARYIHEK